MSNRYQVAPLESLGVLRASGPDAVAFLQGQLSNDLALLSPTRALLAGYHNPHGRVIALLRLLQAGPLELLAVLPRELALPVVRRLGKFILRSKVQLGDESARWQVHGVVAAGGETPPGWPAQPEACATYDGGHVVQIAAAPARWLVLTPAGAGVPLPGTAQRVAALEWQRHAVASGEPQVYAATSEQFVAQMLNLDVLGAIAFEKGCYTGQEVIARAHYRGRVKRRLQRFATRAATQLQHGAAGTLADGRTFRVVESVARPDGRCEFLAVTAYGEAAAADEPRAPAPSDSALDAESLPLPYPLPG